MARHSTNDGAGIDRRAALALASLALAPVVAPAVANAAGPGDFDPPATMPRFRWEFNALIRWADGRNPTGTYSSGQRIYNTVSGGSFAGPRLRGTVLPGGGDWATMNPPAAELAVASAGRQIAFDARYILRTDDGTHIYVGNRGGLFTGGGMADDPVPPAGERQPGLSTPMFDTPPASRYAFLSRNIYVGVSTARPTETLLRVFRVIAV